MVLRAEILANLAVRQDCVLQATTMRFPPPRGAGRFGGWFFPEFGNHRPLVLTGSLCPDSAAQNGASVFLHARIVARDIAPGCDFSIGNP
jgi:hypothetical protein